MVNLEYILFTCVTAPLFLMYLMLPGRAKLVLGYMIIGIIARLFVSELNALILPLFGNDLVYMTSVITPITEEIIKALPILFYAKVYSDKRDTVMLIAFALGIGFGISFINKRKKLFYTGVFALLTFAAIYHGIFNMLQIDYKYIGACIPIVTYIPVVLLQMKSFRQKQAREKKS